MILGLVSDPRWRAALSAAASDDEDVRLGPTEARRVLAAGTARCLVVDADSTALDVVQRARSGDVPVVVLPSGELEPWRRGRAGRRPAALHDPRTRRVSWLRAELSHSGPTWVDRILAECGRAAGRPLPGPFRAIARRVLEDPTRLATIEAVAPVFGLTPGALRARFRRRGLPSPAWYLRWFRLFAVAQQLRSTGDTISRIAWRLGFHSSGNLCRFVHALTGRLPGGLRAPESSVELLLLFASQGLSTEQVAAWVRLERTLARDRWA